MKKVFIETMGCQMNKSDSERIFGILSHFGYEPCQTAEGANLLIVNTCSIRQLAEDKAFSRIGHWGRWKKKNPNLKVAFCGCVAQQSGPSIMKRAPYVDLVFGTHNIYELPRLISAVEAGEKVCAIRDIPVEEEKFPVDRAIGTNAWIPIMEGCNNFCTYCVVPYTRGRERSRQVEVIVKEAKEAIAAGFKEITLLGQNVDSFGKDINANLAGLLRQLNALEGDFRIRFTTSYPTDITDELILAVKECDKVCEYFHIPMQSGNDEILKKMNRRYSREKYFEIVKKVRDNFKDVAITSDFIVGFPGETQAQFEDSISAIEILKLDYCNSAAYSPRPMTVAAKWEDKFVPEDTKVARLKKINEVIKRSVFESNKVFEGKVLRVLVEGFKKGKIVARAANNKIVHFDGNFAVGDFVNVKIKKASQWCLMGEPQPI